ncbi:oleate hydratase [Micrococcus porci]|uniref:oleate hydratase n=1 Tax=Micrococcus porci TaxID=2856555 RepID=UPI001CCE8558|nr:oleate hydratase [Micrococcus porci]UBH25015.1 oleate hydratase [Micrococcus porci]
MGKVRGDQAVQSLQPHKVLDSDSSHGRLIRQQGERVPTDGDFTLSDRAQKEIVKLFIASESSLEGRTIGEWFSEDFFESNFWTYWATMFAFETWHSLAEMRRYLLRFVHAIDGLADFSALKFNRYDQYDSMVKPLLAYLEPHGVDFRYSTTVRDVRVETADGKVRAERLLLTVDGVQQEQEVGEDDLVSVTNGSITESTTYGDHHTPAPSTTEPGGSWTLWENLAEQSPLFGRPGVFYRGLPERSWFVSATATVESREVEEHIERLTQRPLHDGKVNTGGIVTATDSPWMLSFTVHRQPHFPTQRPDQTIVWIHALYSDTEGAYVKKPVTECTGEEITQEWLYHLGVPEDRIPEPAAQESVNTVLVYMPFITSYFMPRRAGDRPAVMPEGSMNLAFIGNFAESPTRDTVFTTEYSVRTAMEAVYTLFDVERGVPEVFASATDLRELI